jgi:hypothetical protein
MDDYNLEMSVYEWKSKYVAGITTMLLALTLLKKNTSFVKYILSDGHGIDHTTNKKIMIPTLGILQF